MSKKCPKCNWMNLDSNHYCGHCGENISAWHDRWEVYNATDYKIVRNSEYSKYQNITNEYNRIREKWYYKTAKWIDDLFSNKLKFSIDWGEVIGLISIFAGVFVISGAIFLMVKSCSNEHKLQAIKIDGLYGIGYDEDEMLVKPLFDSISPAVYSNQWKLIDKKTGLVGVAYVTDSVQNIVKPMFKEIERNNDLMTILSTDNDKYRVAYKGVLKNVGPFSKIESVYDYSANPRRHSYIVTYTDGMKDIMALNGSVGNDRYSNDRYNRISIDPSNVIRGYKHSNSTYYILDLEGKLLFRKRAWAIYGFCDGVSWAHLTRNDILNNKLHLIDLKGNTVSTKTAAWTQEFSEGIGTYIKPGDRTNIYAIDTSGKELFRFHGSYAYPSTMGLIPVRHGSQYTGKIGFVDHNGKRVIPFIYDCDQTKWYAFDRDSTMSISLDGKKGRLHRNGTFTPDSHSE